MTDELTLLPSRTSLPRGTSALPGTEVAASQRGRIMQAIVEEVAESGYVACSVAAVTARARVSRSAFYGQFADKEDAFSAAHMAASRQLLDLIAAAVGAAPASDWRARHRAGVGAYVDGLAGSPAYATSFMVELRAAGPRLLDQRDRVMDEHARRLGAVAAAARRERRAQPRVPPAVLLGLAAGADELVTREIRGGRVDALDRLVKPIVALHLAVFAPER